MNFNLVEMYNGLLRFNKHILNELAEGLKHLPNLDGVSKGDSLIINEQGNPAWGSAAFIPTFENGLIPPLDGSDGDVGVRVPEFYICVKDTGTKYQLWISDFNIDGTFLGLALVAFILFGLGRSFVLIPVSLLRLNLIK